MKCRTILAATGFCFALLPQAGSATSYDVLELPAVPSPMASKSLIYSIERFGDRYFATGHRGHILFSDDEGATWQQAEVPVRSAITALHFPTPELGWAVGHEGVILHSSDGGKTWVKQYDGNRYGEEGLAYYQKMVEADPDNEDLPYFVDEMEFAISQGADKPLFGVRFHTPEYGHVMGAYGMILRTVDGGKTWEHGLHNVENDSFYHVFDFAPLPEEGKFFLSGEAGLFLVGDVNERNARRVHSVPWEGSFFASSDTADGAIVMGGLRGRMFRTEDAGDTWTVVEKPTTDAIVDLARLPDDRIVAVSIEGRVLISEDNGLSFSTVPGDVSSTGSIFAVAEGPGSSVLIGGPSGIRKLELPPRQQ